MNAPLKPIKEGLREVIQLPISQKQKELASQACEDLVRNIKKAIKPLPDACLKLAIKVQEGTLDKDSANSKFVALGDPIQKELEKMEVKIKEIGIPL